MRTYLLLAMLVGVSFIGSNCGGGGVGDPCVPEEEYQANFSGFSVGEVNIESRSFQCQTRVCLVNNFRGRVSCPYGQTAATAAKCQDPEACKPGSPEHEISCRLPDRDGAVVSERITATVKPQFEERQAEQAVYCSCRCGGPDPNARYCECPSGFSCIDLVDDVGDLGGGKAQLAGKYCVKDNTEYNPSSPPSKDCLNASGNCGSTIDRNGNAWGVNPPHAGASTPSEDTDDEDKG